MLAGGGCELPVPTRSSPVDPLTETRLEIADADTGFTLVTASGAGETASQTPRLVYELAVLHVLVPQEQEAAMDKVWNFLREDVLDAETRLRLRQNGLRVGVGHAQDWEPIKAAMDAIDGHRVTFATPLRAPVGHLLGLELDSEPREQTLFYVGRDGILSGSTWRDSRNVLRVTYVPDPHDIENVVLLAVPEVQQRRKGWEWVRTEAGLWQVPRHERRAFDAAAFAVTLCPGEFALVAPSDAPRVYGLLGWAFMTRECEGRRYNSYVFLRPEVRRVGQHD